MLNDWLPLIILIVAFSTGILMMVIGEKNEKLRTSVNLTSAAINIILIGIMLLGVSQGAVFETRLPLLPDINLVLKADALSLAFVTLSGVLWFFTTIYAVGYFKKGKHKSRFFGFFSLCVFSTLGVALAGNLITFLIFYELLTLATYPLIVHKGNDDSLKSGKTYLRYTMIGGAILMVAVVWLKSIAGALDFSTPDILLNTPNIDPTTITIIFVMLMIGLGVKAALFPLHGWLPRAMAAPAPVSSLLHAVAVVKAGAFGIIRVVYDVYGVDLASSLGVLQVLLVFACITIIYGSVRAIYQDDIKKRLAYSTVSQVSYITLGIALAGPIAAVGAIMHLVHQGLMKITMFFCAGLLAETHHIYKVSQLNGIAKKMPITMTAFTIAILGMIGIPPIAGFVSKWYLGVGAIETGNTWVIAVLAGSSLLNAIYFLPLVYRAWFLAPSLESQDTGHASLPTQLSTPVYATQHAELPAEQHTEHQNHIENKPTLEAHWMMLLPPVVTITFAILAGLFANSQYSALSWSKLIASSDSIGFSQTTTLLQSSILPQQMSSLLIWSILLPLILAALIIIRPKAIQLTYLMPLCAIPAIYLGFQPEYYFQSIPFLFFGSELSLDELSQGFLLLAGLLWLLSSTYALFYPHLGNNKPTFMALFCVAMASSFGLVLSTDMFGFLTFFTLMSLSSYVLIIRDKTAPAILAANVYIKWVIVGEVAIFSAFCILNYMDISQQIVSPTLLQFMGLMLVVGFGIKIGLFGFHAWLPLAHPVAAVPASALLSGFMVKAGMIGWLKFFPFQSNDLATFYHLGLLTIVIGAIGAFYAAIKGVMQKDPKAVLAYSTVSQMGILSACFGVILAFPALKDAMTSAIIFYAIHHGLAKSALFLSVGTTPLLNKQSNTPVFLRGMTYSTMVLPALSLVGAAFTSGFFAKNEVKILLIDLPYLKYAIIISALFTGLLMCRFIHMAYDKGQKNSAHGKKSEYPLLAICLVNTLLVLLAPWSLLNEKYTLTSLLSLVSLNSFISSLVPIVVAIIVYKLLVTFILDGRVTFSIDGLKLVAIKKLFLSGEKLTPKIVQDKAVNLGLLAQLKNFIDKKLSPQEVMPLNMQSTYVSVVLISVCILLLVAFGV
ncbi:complex I subunit 5 family protein [Colwellia hornerae]|uniref:Sodium:proton antiporter n=1 Tax=Colwellia hornerae TaxID=89402 RepID=A0ABY3HAC8_9GAMM|nr:proton-conducting transporter membrane subunit [Colwellia hornerae]TWX52171.1 sodium:proton antiporter [Colwellia hornerae]TWX57520.1 sodium:proton antiporter [Colwellia hornerae]